MTQDIDNPFKGYYSSTRAAEIIAANNNSAVQPNNIPKWVKEGRLHPHIYNENVRAMVPITEPQQRISYYFPADEVENFKLKKRGPKPKEDAKSRETYYQRWYDENRDKRNSRRRKKRETVESQADGTREEEDQNGAR